MKPELFIIGGPKCGTTALCTYLAGHPAICFSEPKEPKFFHTDFAGAHRLVHDEAEYMARFAYDPQRHRMLAEGTVWYLYSQTAVSNILAFNPDARFVVMIRNPVDLAYSLHSQLLYGGDEEVESFEEAWRLQEARKASQQVPSGARDPKALLYGEVAKLGEQVERLLSVVPRERVLVVNHEDFSQNPQREYRKVLDFAGLPDDARDSFERVNENRALRRNPLTSILFQLRKVKLALGIRGSFGIWQALQPLVAKRAQRAGLPEAFADELREHFKADIERLEHLVELDLTAWKSTASHSPDKASTDSP
ncbi:MAG: sulfotransferase family protein [Erythrobacter sp.]|uniref:sulfotransferase family protein n=1 Tax=Erythrobacter sp. TaxID=1042 RepID=UPI003A8A335B